MAKQTPKVLESANRTRAWRLAIVVGATAMMAAVAAGGVGAKDPSPNASSSAFDAPGHQKDAVQNVFSAKGSDGNSTSGLFEIQDWSFGVENPTTVGSASGGAASGKVQFNDLKVTKKVDMSSPDLFSKICKGTHIPEVTIEMRKAGGESKGNGTPFLRYNFDTVFVTKIDWSGPGDEGPEESITFVFGALKVTYISQDPATGQTVENSFAWDAVTNSGEGGSDSNSTIA